MLWIPRICVCLCTCNFFCTANFHRFLFVRAISVLWISIRVSHLRVHVCYWASTLPRFLHTCSFSTSILRYRRSYKCWLYQETTSRVVVRWPSSATTVLPLKTITTETTRSNQNTDWRYIQQSIRNESKRRHIHLTRRQDERIFTTWTEETTFSAARPIAIPTKRYSQIWGDPQSLCLSTMHDNTIGDD